MRVSNMFEDYGYTAERFVELAGKNIFGPVTSLIDKSLTDLSSAPYGGNLTCKSWKSRIIEECRNNSFFFFNNFVKIRTEYGVYRPMRWNRSRFFQILMDGQKISSYIRAPRQLSGKTTTIAAQLLYHNVFTDDFCFLLSDNDSVIMARVDEMTSQLPSFMNMPMPERRVVIQPYDLRCLGTKRFYKDILSVLRNSNVHVFLDDVERIDKINTRIIPVLFDIQDFLKKEKSECGDNKLVISASGVSFRSARNLLRRNMVEKDPKTESGDLFTFGDKYGVFLRFTGEDYSEMENIDSTLDRLRSSISEEAYDYEVNCND